MRIPNPEEEGQIKVILPDQTGIASAAQKVPRFDFSDDIEGFNGRRQNQELSIGGNGHIAAEVQYGSPSKERV